MQKGFRIAAMAGALSMAMSGSAFAVNNLTFDGWTVSNGDITSNSATVCQSTDYDCSVVASGKGFQQVTVSPSSSNTTGDPNTSYIMTIVTDQNANSTSGDPADLGFYDVSFVKMQVSLGGTGSTTGNVNGIYGQQAINNVTSSGSSATSFQSTTNISTGWALASNSPISISQNLTDNGNTNDTGDDFSSNFYYASDNTADGTRTGFEMSIDQKAGLASPGVTTSANDVQTFALRERQGTKLQTASPSGGYTLGGDTVSWAAGDDAKAIWLGQNINLDSTGTSGTTLGSTFGYLSFDNVTGDSNPPATEFGFAATKANAPWVWDDSAFNINNSVKPCLSDPTGVTCP